MCVAEFQCRIINVMSMQMLYCFEVIVKRSYNSFVLS